MVKEGFQALKWPPICGKTREFQTEKTPFSRKKHFLWQMILKHRTLRLVNRAYCVKSDAIMWNHWNFKVKTLFFFSFTGPWRRMKCLKKDPFSCEISNDDTYPTCQTMTLLGAYNDHYDERWHIYYTMIQNVLLILSITLYIYICQTNTY